MNNNLPRRQPPTRPVNKPVTASPAKPRDKLPARFFLSAPGVRKDGTPIPPEDCEASLLITSTGLPAFTCIEHQLENKQTGRWDIFELCPQAYAVGCPLCATKNRPAEKMFLSCLEIRDRSFTGDDGVERISRFRRRILNVLEPQWKFFEDIVERHGSLRGALINAVRVDAKDPKIGQLTFVDMISEADMIGTFGNRAYIRSGATVKAENENLIDLPFAELFPSPQVNDLIAKYGGEPVVGFNDKTVPWELLDDTIPY